MNVCRPCSSDVTDDAWALVAPSLMLLPDAARQREHALREVFGGVRYVIKYVIKAGAPWRWMPNGPSPWAAVWQQAQRWLAAGCCDALPRTCGLCCGSGPRRSDARAGYGGAKRKRGPKLHLAVDTPGHPLALHMTPASTNDRAGAAKGVRQLRGRRFPWRSPCFPPEPRVAAGASPEPQAAQTDKDADIVTYLRRPEVLLKKVHGCGSAVSTHTPETHIHRLRQRLEAGPGRLLTEDGGYTLDATIFEQAGRWRRRSEPGNFLKAATVSARTAGSNGL